VALDPSLPLALEHSGAQLAAIVESSHDAIIGKTLDGVVTSWNAAAERLFGYTADEMVGQSILKLIPAERRSEEDMILSRLRRGERIDSYETERLRKDGTRVELSLTISPVRDRTGRVIGASKIARDISAARAAARELQRSEEALRLAGQRKDEFLAVLAHELRNPLAPIANTLEALRIGGIDPATTRELLAVAHRQLQHLVRLVDDLMEVSRITRDAIDLRRESMPLQAAVQSAIEISQPLIAERKHRLEIDLQPDRLMVSGDRTRLAQVVANLLNNAAKYTPEGGRIRVQLTREGDEAVVRVTDNGAGIPAEMLTRVFEMFTRVDRALERSQGGLGIGLALVKRLVQLHGGTAEAHSEGLGRGSEFVIRLPLATGKSQGDATMKPEPELPGSRILIADDNKDAARVLALLLRTLGQDVHVAHDGEQAIEKAKELKPDIVLLDLGMPVLSGYEAARRIRREPWGTGLLLVAVTGWGQEHDKHRTKAAGFDLHLVKPVTAAVLKELLAGVTPANRA
jgi:two-component system, chemotaxis family, CheB/CheR fusion protein